jgi:hypothetical protein
MDKTKQNFWLDVTLFAVFLATAITGFLLWLVIPGPPGAAFPGGYCSAWAAIHICFGAAGLAGIVIHIARHWGWLKALRGRSLSGMQAKVRTNRLVDRIMWFTFIAANGFGVITGALHFGDPTYSAGMPERLHVIFGAASTSLMALHLVLHRQWIASTARRFVHRDFKCAKGLPGQENIRNAPRLP